jgi:hypothetical protein
MRHFLRESQIDWSGMEPVVRAVPEHLRTGEISQE